MKTPAFPDQSNAYLAQHIALLTDSYLRLLGKPLFDKPTDKVSLAEQLFKAPFVLLSHNTDADPLFNYANKMGLNVFEIHWQQLVKTPSRLSAEPVNREQREQLLAQVTEFGFIDDYQGVRISQTGKRFMINNAVVWNLIDGHGQYQGQAACFSDWRFL